MLKLFSRVSLLVSAVLFAVPALSLAADYYVSPNGGGNGSISSPYSLSTVCSGSSAVQPGDTVWLRGGNYGSYGNSTINCQLNGTSSSPIKLRAYPGERASILGGLGVYSNYVWYWGIEIYNSFTRSTSECGSFPSIKPPDGVFFSQGATGNKFINMVIHDVANGISDQQEAVATEDYGNLLYNIGWSSSCDRGHGHNLYLQNNGSLKLVQDNLAWNSYDIGMQAYSGAANVSNIWFVGNAFWNSGLPGGHRVDNLYIGDSASPKQNILVQDSVMYNPLDASSGETGYNQAGSGSNYDITLKNNYWIGAVPTGYVTLMLTNWATTNVTGNMFVGPLSLSGIGAYNWSGNSYYVSSAPSGDSGSSSSGSYPTGVRVIVRPNKYEQGRANIIVLNFAKNSSVQADLSGSGLTSGQNFEIRDAQNFWGPPVVTGTYNGGTVTLPMNLTAVSQIVNDSTPAHTSAEFGAFVVLPTSGATSSPSTTPTVTVSISVSPSSASVNPGGTQQFTASVSGSSNTGVTWSLSPATGSISSSGLYTAPSTVSSQTSVKVIGTSQADGSKTASATITLNASPTTSSTGGSVGTNGTGSSWWSFDTNAIQGSTVIDGSGNGLNGVLSNVTSVAGAVNQALSFNGSNSVVTVNANTALDLVNNLTISAWVRTTNGSRVEDVIGKYDASGTEFGWMLKTLPTGVIGLRVGGSNTGNGVRDLADTKPINDGNWHHVAIVITLGSNVQFYVDGQPTSNQGLPTKAAIANAPLWIGTIPFTYYGYPFTGSLDQVRVDAQALTAAQIAALASSTSGTPTTVGVSVAVVPTSATMNAGTTQQFTATVTGTTNTAVTWSINNGLGSISSSGLYTAPSSVSSPASVIVKATSQADTSKYGTATITINPVLQAPAPSGSSTGAAASYSFDTAAISGSTVIDGSGNNVNGILSNATSVAGRVNQALAFNGVNSVVTVPSNSRLDLVNSMTVSAWVKTTNNSRTEDFIGKYDATASEYGWIVKVLSSGVVGLRVGGNNSVNGLRDVADTTPINDGSWHHVAVVINLGSNVQFYIDGSLRTTQQLPTKAYGTSAPMWIGAIPFNYFGMPFTGSLDEVRIDAQALSASAIAALAGGGTTTTSSGTTSSGGTVTGGLAASWTFDSSDVSGSLVLDSSGDQLNGVAYGTTSVTGRNNQAFAFNGSNSSVAVSANPKLDLANSMTIASWVKTTNNSRTEDVIGKYDATGNEWGWIVKVLSTGVVGLRVGGNNSVNGVRDVADTTPINDGNWHHVAVVINLGSNAQFYVDGTLRSTQPIPTAAQTNTMPLYIGALPFSYYGMPFTGSLDSVKVYNQALGGAAIAQLAQ